MAEKWVEAYEDLKKFIADHPKIEIGEKGVSIMRDIRPEFYRHFDIVRDTIIKEYLAAELDKACELGKAYADISNVVQQDMNLEAIDVNGSLNGFLQKPLESLTSALFMPLFDLLKGSTTEASFVQEVQKSVKAFFKPLFREGYNRWGTMALLRLLSPNCLWDGKPNDLNAEVNRNAEFNPGLYNDDVPDLQQKRRMEFSCLQRASFVMPDVLVQSKYLNAYVSLKSQWYEVRCKSKSLSGNLEWLDLQQLYYKFGHCRPDMTLDMTIHLARESADELKVLADYCHMARPDILIEFMEDDDWYDSKHIGRIIFNNNMFAPRLGSYVISRVSVPPEAFAAPEAEPVGLQQSSDGVATTAPIEEEPLLGAVDTAEQVETPQDIAATTASIEEEPLQDTATTGAPNIPATPHTSPPAKRCLSLADLPDSIHVISAGYDASMLEPVVQTLSQWLTLQDQMAAQELESTESQVTDYESTTAELHETDQ